MVILITGASHTGKTALAQKLLEKYKYPYLSIDHLKMGLIRSGNTELTPMSLSLIHILTAADFNFDKETVTINKSYQRLHGEDVITSPKTKKSNRTIKMPKFLCEEMQEYIGMLYGLKKKDRIFTVTKSYLHHEMDRGAKAAGVKRIRIHDLRHSHISLLIDMGFSAVAIADRVGHESIEITYRYAHLFPSKQTEMADRLDDLGKGDF